MWVAIVLECVDVGAFELLDYLGSIGMALGRCLMCCVHRLLAFW